MLQRLLMRFLKHATRLLLLKKNARSAFKHAGLPLPQCASKSLRQTAWPNAGDLLHFRIFLEKNRSKKFVPRKQFLRELFSFFFLNFSPFEPIKIFNFFLKKLRKYFDWLDIWRTQGVGRAKPLICVACDDRNDLDAVKLPANDSFACWLAYSL